VQVPALFKAVVDTLNLEITSGETIWVVAGSLIVGCEYCTPTDFASVHLISRVIPDGAARIGATLFSELLNAVFASIGQHAVRKVARETFEHLLSLDLKFHLSKQTGGLTRAIDRGTKCVVPPASKTILLTSPQRHHVRPAVGIVQDCSNCAGGFIGLWDTRTSRSAVPRVFSHPVVDTCRRTSLGGILLPSQF
jgi:ATP-binding cassette subfamily B (MDR/TAP) protein 7